MKFTTTNYYKGQGQSEKNFQPQLFSLFIYSRFFFVLRKFRVDKFYFCVSIFLFTPHFPMVCCFCWIFRLKCMPNSLIIVKRIPLTG